MQHTLNEIFINKLIYKYINYIYQYMLAITEKWNEVVHGYTFPPDTPHKIKIMNTMDFDMLSDTNENLEWFLDCLDEYNKWRNVEGWHIQYGQWLRGKLQLNIISSTYIYNGRSFVIINTSFLNFIKKCKYYYKNKINHYKKHIIYRTIHGKFPRLKYSRI
jgi:hypothetical protein